MPKVSVIMAMYNCEETLSVAIDSIINQTYTDWELIMCDDCSKDRTYEIACEYADIYDNITVLKNEKNMYAGYSRNRCLEIAKGEYIAIMDADDISLPERLEKQISFLEKNLEYALVSSGAIIFDEKGDRLERGLGDAYTFQNPVQQQKPIIQPAVIMRKDAFELLGGYIVSPETSRCEDLDLWYRFRVSGLKGYVLQECLVKVRERAEDFKRRTVRASIGMVKVNKKYYKLLNVPFRWHFLIIKPFVSAILPNWFMIWYHSKR